MVSNTRKKREAELLDELFTLVDQFTDLREKRMPLKELDSRARPLIVEIRQLRGWSTEDHKE